MMLAMVKAKKIGRFAIVYEPYLDREAKKWDTFVVSNAPNRVSIMAFLTEFVLDELKREASGQSTGTEQGYADESGYTRVPPDGEKN
jgi:hypothetical protein